MKNKISLLLMMSIFTNLMFGSFPNIVNADSGNTPMLNNFNDRGYTLSQKPAFNFNIPNSGQGNKVHYKIEIATGGNVTFTGAGVIRYEEEADGSYSSINDPQGNYVAISANTNHSIALKNDGTVWSWGQNLSGEIGDGTNIKRITPKKVHGANDEGYLTGVIAISAGKNHSAALKNDGTVWTWGNNFLGQLGNASKYTYDVDTWVGESSIYPVQSTNLTGIIALSAGGRHTVALKLDGTVWVWGSNEYGKLCLGSNNTDGFGIPNKISNLTGVISIFASELNTYLIKFDGTVYACGNNQYGQIGDGTTDNRNIPTKVHGFNDENYLSGIAKISAGDQHVIALTSTGNVISWGRNIYGRLGNNGSGQSLFPIRVHGENNNGFLVNISDINTSLDHNFGISKNGEVFAWGQNNFGQLGDNSFTTQRFPVKISNINNIKKIASGIYYSIFINNDGKILAFGSNNNGQGGYFGISSAKPVFVGIPGSYQTRNNISFIPPSNLATNQNYIWRVKSIDQDGNESAWVTASNGFRVGIPLPVTVDSIDSFKNDPGQFVSVSGSSVNSARSVKMLSDFKMNIPMTGGVSSGRTAKVNIPLSTKIRTSDNAEFDFSKLTVTGAAQTGSDAVFSQNTNKGGIKFGIEGKTLVFDKPVKLEIPISSHNRSTIDVYVKHGSDNFSKVGLTNRSNASCNSDGSVSPASNKAAVAGGYATIYTCSASEFGVFIQNGVGGYVDTSVSLSVDPGEVTIFAPSTISFGDIQTKNNTGYITIDTASITGVNVTGSTLPGAYFGIMDLQSKDEGYMVQLLSDDILLETNTGVKIHSDNIKLTLTQSGGTIEGEQGGIFLLDGELPPEIASPLYTEITFDEAAATLLSRTGATTPSHGRVGMYGVQPIFKIEVPKFQQIGTYTSIFTMTYVAN